METQPKKQEKQEQNLKRRRYSDLYRETDPVQVRREMYAKLGLVLLGPVLIMIFLLWNVVGQKETPQTVHRSLSPLPPVHSSSSESIPPPKKNKQPQWFSPKEFFPNGAGKWQGKEGVWRGYCTQQFSLLAIRDFLTWQKYLVEFEIQLTSGRISLAMRGFRSENTFDSFVRASNLHIYPKKWHRVQVKSLPDKLELLVAGSKQKFSKRAQVYTEPGSFAFILEPYQGFPGAVAIRNVKFKNLAEKP